jgi:hypothetical protein
VGLPIHDAARRAIAHAGHVLATDIEHAETDLSKLTHHGRYHQQQAPATTAATEAPVSLITEIKTELASLAAKAEHVDDEAMAKVESLKATPEGAEVFELVSSLAENVAKSVLPAGALSTVAGMLKGVVSLATAGGVTEVSGTAEAADAPQPVAAGPVVAGQA